MTYKHLQAGDQSVRPEELLDGPDVVAGQEEMGREGVPQGVAGGVLGDAGCSRGDMEGSLDGPLVDVVAAPHSGPRIAAELQRTATD